jgi:hypothetical protein
MTVTNLIPLFVLPVDETKYNLVPQDSKQPTQIFWRKLLPPSSGQKRHFSTNYMMCPSRRLY